ncbi:ArsS family sensor histidine kinase [Halarcobacter sp.]|uniref:ArsS family sensor histidine kinase n=1 Tax=Halarcobacter sp. TaxID=2321133 RepID=UPI0029F58CAF|nr:ArsS family sensor histidine kinase [Halarcobacter sp.]
MDKKNSIFFKITLFFFVIFLIINSLIYLQFSLDYKNYQALIFKKYISVIKTVEKDIRLGLSSEIINEKISAVNMQLAQITYNELKKKNPEKLEFDDEEDMIHLYKYNNETFVYFDPKPPIMNEEFKPPRFDKKFLPKPPEILLIDKSFSSKDRFFWLIVLLFIDILLVWFYYFLFKKLKPLIKLKNEINKFSEGNLEIDTTLEGDDEIAQVSNEFNNAIEKIRDLNSSRKLFLRNILHELKTPITKGKLVSDTLEEGKKRDVLQRAFSRLEYLLEEFVKLEELTSGQITLERKEYRIIDLLDQSLDILLIDKSQVDIYTNLTTIYVDYELFAISLKNLIDNAMKYNTEGKPEIVINSDSLIIKNHGKALKKPFDEYLKPFNRDYESIDKGLGLGLYITNSIIKRHGYNLYYYFNNNYHIFKIQF